MHSERSDWPRAPRAGRGAGAHLVKARGSNAEDGEQSSPKVELHITHRGKRHTEAHRHKRELELPSGVQSGRCDGGQAWATRAGRRTLLSSVMSYEKYSMTTSTGVVSTFINW